MQTSSGAYSHSSSASTNRERNGELDLDALAALDTEGLGRLYSEGRITDIGSLAGRPRGRMLAVRGLDREPIAPLLRRLAGSRAFPWGGKSFNGAGEAGTGVNRVHLFGRHQLFPFLTRAAPSVLDGRPCIVLDYDLPDNPGFIRAIHDEVREVARGLYLGPAMWKGAQGPTFVLWFALDTRDQAEPFGEKGAFG